MHVSAKANILKGVFMVISANVISQPGAKGVAL